MARYNLSITGHDFSLPLLGTICFNVQPVLHWSAFSSLVWGIHRVTSSPSADRHKSYTIGTLVKGSMVDAVWFLKSQNGESALNHRYGFSPLNLTFQNLSYYSYIDFRQIRGMPLQNRHQKFVGQRYSKTIIRNN